MSIGQKKNKQTKPQKPDWRISWSTTRYLRHRAETLQTSLQWGPAGTASPHRGPVWSQDVPRWCGAGPKRLSQVFVRTPGDRCQAWGCRGVLHTAPPLPGLRPVGPGREPGTGGAGPLSKSPSNAGLPNRAHRHDSANNVANGPTSLAKEPECPELPRAARNTLAGTAWGNAGLRPLLVPFSRQEQRGGTRKKRQTGPQPPPETGL